jgi:2-methylcitrate dehydratase PrpD
MTEARQPSHGAMAALLERLQRLSYAGLPSRVIEHTEWCVLDTLGCGLFGSGQPWSRIAAEEMFREGGEGHASVFGHAGTLPPPAAALCNGIACHGFELDDLLDEAIVHPGAVVVPAALAAAEAANASGKRLLLGVLAGYEVMNRVGLALGLNPAHRGFHKTSLVGPVAAAVAAGVVRGLTLPELQSAVGLACSAAAGIKTFATGEGGGMMKRLHAGRSAEAGVRLAQLAARGYTGPPNAVDGRFGLLEVFGADTARPEPLTQGLAERWAVEQVFVKMFPCCSWIQAVVQQIVALRGPEPWRVEEVKRVRIGVNSYALRINGEPAPVDTMGAQYSIPYCAALALTADPSDPDLYLDAAVADESRRALARAIELFIDPEMDAAYPRHYGASVEIELQNGSRMRSSILDPHGMPGDPCSEVERLEKFTRLAARVLPTPAIENAAVAVCELESFGSVRALTRLLKE